MSLVQCRLVRQFASSLALFASVSGAIAAEVGTVAEGSDDLSILNEAHRLACTHRLSGPITYGDVARVEQAMTSVSGQPVICLDSPGGSFAEGIALAKAFRARGIATLVETGDECLSACAIAFLGGSYEVLGTTTLRALQPGGRLGFHAPSVALPDGSYSSEAVEGSYGAALEHITVAIRAFGLPDESGNVLLPNSLLVEMLVTPPEKMRLVETVNDAALWDIDLAVELTPLDGRAFAAQACFNGFHWAAGQAAPAPSADDLAGLVVEESGGGGLRFVSRPGTDVEAQCDITPGAASNFNIVGMHSRYFAFTSLAHGLPGTTSIASLR